MEHFFNTIQGWFNYRPIYEAAIQAAPESGALFVEIGAWKGKSSAFMAVEIINSGKNIRFDILDTFAGSDEKAHHIDPDIINGTLEETFRRNMAPVIDQPFLRVRKGNSSEFAASYEDSSIDFIMIDGDHTYEGVLRDLKAFWPKLKNGGVMAGDDYKWRSVAKAVDQFFADEPGIEFPNNGKLWRVIK